MIAVLLCLKRKKSKLFKGYAPTPTRGGGRGEGGGGREEGGREEGERRREGGGGRGQAYSIPQTSTCHVTCLWHVCFFFLQKTDVPIFFCIRPCIDRMYDFSVTIPRCYKMSMSTVCFLAQPSSQRLKFASAVSKC